MNGTNNLPKQQWRTGMEGSLWNTGAELNITPFQERQAFIQTELGDYPKEEQE